MTFRLTCVVLMITVLCTLSGCGSSGDGSRPGDNGVFYGGSTETEVEAVPGLTYLSEPSKLVGFTSASSGYTYADGDYVTFSINGFALPMIEATPVVSVLSYGTPGVLDTFSTNLSILFTMLDTDSATPGIQLPDVNYASVVPPGGITVTEFFETPIQSDFIDMATAMFFEGTYTPTTETFPISVNVSGLTGTLVLQNNGGDDLTITTNGIHTFATEVADGFAYNVTVLTRPAGQGVTFTSSASGLVLGAEVTVNVLCETGYIVGGTLTNFTGSREYPNLVLRNSSNGETITVTSNGYFEFSQTLYNGDAYNIVIDTIEPDESPTFINGNSSGTIPNADVTNVDIDCPGRVMLHPINVADNISPDGYDVGKLVGSGGSTAVDMDNAGNVIIAWTQADGFNGHIFYSRYDAATSTWSHPPAADTSSAFRISPEDTYAIEPKVGMDNLGNALILWLQVGGQNATNQIFMSEYKDGVWDHPDDLNDTFPVLNGTDASDLVMSVSDNGVDTSYASIAWTSTVTGLTSLPDPTNPPTFRKKSGTVDRDVFMVTGTKAVGSNWVWGTVEHIDLPNDSYVDPANTGENLEGESPLESIAKVTDIAVNNSGEAVLVWEELGHHGDYTSRGRPDGNWDDVPHECTQAVFMATYNPVSGVWTVPTTFSAPISYEYVEARDPACAISDNGDVVIAWREHNSSDPSEAIFVGGRLEKRSGIWGTPQPMGDNYEMFVPDVAIDSAGNTIISWAQATTVVFDGRVQIFRFEYRGGLWSSGSTGVISPASTDSSGPVVAMSDDNPVSAIIVWQQSDGTNRQVYLAESRGNVWDDPDDILDTISPPGTETEVNTEAVAMNGLGDTIIIWSQDDGVNKQLFMSEYR